MTVLEWSSLTAAQLVPIGKALPVPVTHLGDVLQTVHAGRAGELALATFCTNTKKTLWEI